MKLNCDLAESFGAWQMGLDHAVIPHIDMANIACGFHAGDANVMANTLKITAQHGTEIGAHPSYPDLAGFGRRNMQLSHNELINLIHYQIAALDGMARCYDQDVSYVKPHGALYNTMMTDPTVLQSVMQAVASFHKPLKLMVLATSHWPQHLKLAEELGITLLFEAFADRRYDDNGQLLNRAKTGAVLEKEAILAQVSQLISNQSVTTDTGKQMRIKADTLCVHGDNQEAIALIKQINALCQK